MGIAAANSINLFILSRRKHFFRIQAPATLKQALPAKYFVDPRDATPEPVSRIEDRRIHVGDLLGTRQQSGGKLALILLEFREEQGRSLRPNRPVTQQSAHDAHPLTEEIVLGQQINHYVVVISGVKGDVLIAAAFDNSANYIQRVIPIERRDLDSDHIWNLGKLPPEFIWQNTTAYCWLQIKANDGSDGGDGPTIFKQLRFWFSLKSSETQKHRVISEGNSELRLGCCLLQISTDARDSDHACRSSLLKREFKNWFQQVEFWIPNRELCRVNSYRNSPCPGSQIVAS